MAEAALWFEDVPLSSSGIPMIMFRLFPELAPDIWGNSVEDLPQLGLPRQTNARFSFSSPLPLGMGYHRSQKKIIPFDLTSIQVVGLSCAACHTGRVKLDDGSIRYLLGGTSTQFDPNKFGDAVYRTVTRPDFTGAKFRELIKKKGTIKPWIYNDIRMAPQQALELVIFLQKKDENGAYLSDSIVKAVKDTVLARQGAIDKLLGPLYTKDSPSLYGGTPGQADALGKIAVISESHALTAAVVDLPAVWRQDTREYAQFDGSIRDPLFRNLAAEFGVGGVAIDVNVVNAEKVAKLVVGLPAPKFPFNIDNAAAGRGKALFASYCSSCHGSTDIGAAPKTVRVPFSVDRGASTARAKQLDSKAIAAIAAALKNACKTGQRRDTNTPWLPNSYSEVDLKSCDVDPADILFDQTSNPGTVGQALNGIWATAPYLHNGSVPTLRALLVPSLRPETFYRGNLSYDKKDLGFNYKSKESDNISGTIYDTKKIGNGNQGHSTLEMNGGKDWSKDERGLNDILEYMKTI